SLSVPLSLFSFCLPSPPCSTLFPYTTLFRSVVDIGTDDRRIGPLRVDGLGIRLELTHVLVFVPAVLSDSPVGNIVDGKPIWFIPDRKSTRLNSSHVSISYAVSCLTKINTTYT